MNFWDNISKQPLRLLLAICIREDLSRGEENLKLGPKIIAANQPNLSDGFFLPFVFQEKLHFLSQTDTFNLPTLRTLLIKADQILVKSGCGQKLDDKKFYRLKGEYLLVIAFHRLIRTVEQLNGH